MKNEPERKEEGQGRGRRAVRSGERGGGGGGRGAADRGRVSGGARLIARVPHARLVPKGHGACLVAGACHLYAQILTGRCLLRLREQPYRHRVIRGAKHNSALSALGYLLQLFYVSPAERLMGTVCPAGLKLQISQRRADAGF